MRVYGSEHLRCHIKEIFQIIFFVTCGSLKDSLSVLTRDVEAEAGSGSGGSGKFLWKRKRKLEAEAVEAVNFCGSGSGSWKR